MAQRDSYASRAASSSLLISRANPTLSRRAVIHKMNKRRERSNDRRALFRGIILRDVIIERIRCAKDAPLAFLMNQTDFYPKMSVRCLPRAIWRSVLICSAIPPAISEPTGGAGRALLQNQYPSPSISCMLRYLANSFLPFRVMNTPASRSC